jgi:hypothetical protein
MIDDKRSSVARASIVTRSHNLQFGEASGMPKSPPPAPNTTRVPRYVNQTVLECQYSDDLRYRVVLVHDTSGNVQLRCETWDLSDWEYCGQAFWNPAGQGNTITDTIDNARL